MGWGASPGSTKVNRRGARLLIQRCSTPDGVFRLNEHVELLIKKLSYRKLSQEEIIAAIRRYNY